MNAIQFNFICALHKRQVVEKVIEKFQLKMVTRLNNFATNLDAFFVIVVSDLGKKM